MAPDKPKTEAVPEKRGRGRPTSANPASASARIRATPADRARWQAAATRRQQNESQWGRDGLEAWWRFCELASELGENPNELVAAVLEDHARVRAAVAELVERATVQPLSKTESRVLRVLSPNEWARIDRAQ